MSKKTAERRNGVGHTVGGRPVTAHDVAKIAGVSQSAVSRTYTNGASVSEPTRFKVIQAATQLGYRPNFIASSLITGRSKIIGVTFPGFGNRFYSAAVEALSAKFARIGYRLMIFIANEGEDSDPVLEEVLRYRVDAVVMVSSMLSSRFADECRQIGLPVVMLNRKTKSSLVSSVTVDNREGARQIGAFLDAGNHKRFAYIAGLASSSTNQDREKGFTEYLTSHGFDPPMRLPGNNSFRDASEATRALLNGRTPPDAIFCASDLMALAAINVARGEFGLRVGKDVSIVGFDDTDLAKWPLLSLTCYSQPLEQMVDRTVQIITESFQSRKMPTAQEVIKGQLVIRESARIPKKGTCIVNGVRIWVRA